MSTSSNQLLSALAPRTLEKLALHCCHVALSKAEVVSEADQSIPYALFVEEGIASVFKPSGSCGVEVCLIGPEGFCGTPLVLHDEAWPYRTIVQADRLAGVRVGAEPFRRLLADDADLRSVLLRSVQVKMVQIAEGLVSSASQRLTQRLARWLLMYRDRLRSDRLYVTHEFMALMVGSQRTSLTAALHEMEGAGLISSRRAQILITNPDALRALAAGGYGVPEKEQARLLRT